MILCNKCVKPMKRVMSFTSKMAYEYYECAKCGNATKPKPIDLSKKYVPIHRNTYGGGE